MPGVSRTPGLPCRDATASVYGFPLYPFYACACQYRAVSRRCDAPLATVSPAGATVSPPGVTVPPSGGIETVSHRVSGETSSEDEDESDASDGSAEAQECGAKRDERSGRSGGAGGALPDINGEETSGTDTGFPVNRSVNADVFVRDGRPSVRRSIDPSIRWSTDPSGRRSRVRRIRAESNTEFPVKTSSGGGFRPNAGEHTGFPVKDAVGERRSARRYFRRHSRFTRPSIGRICRSSPSPSTSFSSERLSGGLTRRTHTGFPVKRAPKVGVPPRASASNRSVSAAVRRYP